MSYPTPDQLILPVKPYKVKGYGFGCNLRRGFFLWMAHLGDDVGGAGDEVVAIGDGEVVWSEMRCGNRRKHNWGGIIVLGHQDNKVPAFARATAGKQTFYSVYGHLADLKVKVGEQVVMGQKLGVVAEGRTPENGWWKVPHLHFAIYIGPWQDRILPGFKRCWEWRTRRQWWQEPKGFIRKYNRV